MALRLAVLGTFGAGNLGDESLFLAFQQNFAALRPDGILSAICPDPEYMRQEHGVEATPLRGLGLLGFWRQARRFAKKNDALVILGGGQIFDFWSGSFGHPFTLFTWTRIFRWSRKPVLVPSIGAYTLRHQLSAFFIRSTLHSALYVSFRDQETQRIARGFGYKKFSPQTPDLAFSLRYTGPQVDSSGWIGISPMVYMHPELWPEGLSALYEGYLNKLAAFAQKKMAENYRLRIFASQIKSDPHAITDLLARLDADGSRRKAGKIDLPEVRDVPTLLHALCSVEAVVATRFHGVLLSLLMEKPVVSIGYQPKNQRLLEAFGFPDSALDLHHFNLEDVERAFEAATKNFDPESQMHSYSAKLKEYRQQLELQYLRLFELAEPARKH